MGKIIEALILCVLIEALGFLIIAGLVWVICFAFAFEFSWKLALGIWAIYVILSAIVKAGRK